MKELNFSKWTRLLVVVLLPFILASCDDSETTTTTTTTPGNTGTTAVDTTGPTLSAVSISGGDSFKYVYVGDTVAIALTASETIKKPTVTVFGNAATVTGTGTGWTAEYAITATNTSGTVTFSISFEDMAGNAGAAVTAVTDGSSVIAFIPAAAVSDIVVFGNELDSKFNQGIRAFDQAISWGECTDGGTKSAAADNDGAGCPSIKWEIKDAATADVATRGKIIEVTYASDAQVAGIFIGVDEPGLNLSPYADGTLSFDVNVTANNDGTTFVYKIDCYQSAGDCPAPGAYNEISLGTLASGWQTISRPIKDSADRGVNTKAIKASLVIFPNPAKASVVYQLDNIQWIAPSDAVAVVGLSEVTIATNGANNTAKSADMITINIKATDIIAKPTVTVAGSTDVTVTGAGINWRATYAVKQTDISGTATFSIAFQDTSATPTSGVVTTTTNNSYVTIEAMAPPEPPAVPVFMNNTFSTPADRTLAGFGGNVSNIVAFTRNGNETWAGTTIGDTTSTTLASALDFSEGTTITVDVWSSVAPGASVLFKVEEAASAGNFTEVRVPTTKQGEWETLSFDFSGYNTAHTYDKANIFFNFDVSDSGNLYYWDNITFNGISTDANTNTAKIEIPTTFDNPAKNYSFASAGGTSFDFGGNSSQFMAQIIKNDGKAYGGTTIGAKKTIPFTTEKKYIAVDIYSPAASVTVKVKVENYADAGTNVEVDKTATVVGWQTIYYDFSAAVNDNTYDKISVFPDFNNGMGNGAIYFVRSITLGTSSGE